MKILLSGPTVFTLLVAMIPLKSDLAKRTRRIMWLSTSSSLKDLARPGLRMTRTHSADSAQRVD